MSEEVRRINAFFRDARKSDVDRALSDVILSDRQSKIFSLFYIRKQDINFIADSLHFSYETVKKELASIRKKLLENI